MVVVGGEGGAPRDRRSINAAVPDTARRNDTHEMAVSINVIHGRGRE